VILDLEYLVLVAVFATPSLSLVFITPRTPSLQTLDSRMSLQSILLVIFSILCAYILTTQVAITATAPATHLAKYLNPQAISNTDWLPIHSGDISAHLACRILEDP
jgi:hypothetical protein